MNEHDERRRVARRAALWTVITLVGILSGAFMIRGVVLDLHDEASHTAAIACLLSAIAAATMFVTRRIEDSGASYRTGYQEGFADGRRVNAVLPFPSEHPERVR